MELRQTDIGGEIISILTKGMYSDPKDTLREYVQNGVDANADKISIKIRQNNITIEDNGHGMDKSVMRNAVRVGVSDKNPKKSVGFMGIGIYSSFHLCNKLTIYSRVKDNKPFQLIFDFKSMRDVLENQKEERFEINGKKQQIALISLLEKHIAFNNLTEKDFHFTNGTRVELSGMQSSFFSSLSKFEEVSEYLEKVVPLPFDPLFKYGETIQSRIQETCEKHKSTFKLIHLTLQINDEKKILFRPYKDIDFKPNPMPPKFYNIETEDEFFGIAWGCLNKGTETIKNDKVRGFIIKKQGFAIGTRNDLLHRFTAKFFQRYVGEIIVINQKLLPNSSRSDFEYSDMRTSFYSKLDEVIQKFNEFGNRHQEQEKAEQELDKAIKEFREIKSQLSFFESNADKLLEFHRILYKSKSDLEKRDKTGWKIPSNRKEDAKNILKLMGNILKEIKDLIENKKKNKSKLKKGNNTTAEDLEKAPQIKQKKYVEPIPESLLEVIEFSGQTLDNELKEILKLIDELFIHGASLNEDDYKQKLIKLKNEIDDLYTNE